MLCPSLLTSQHIDPEQCLSEQQIDRELVISLIWEKIQETDHKRKNGLTDRDCEYFDRLLLALKEWTNEELLERIADSTPSEFRKEFRGW